VKRPRDDAAETLPVVDLDDLLQHRSRLAGAVLLARHNRLSFSRLKELLEETDGNLGAQLRKLEVAGYVKALKEFQDRRPVTWYELTAKGKRALTQHLANLETLIRQAKGA
jgi:DNA-binding MarR family transcriptional regulator